VCFAAGQLMLILSDCISRLARQYQSQRVEKLSFSDVFQVFQGRYSEQDVRVSLAKMVRISIQFDICVRCL
jgi:hypothetical protein